MVKSVPQSLSWFVVVLLLAGAARAADQQAEHDKQIKFVVTSGETGRPIAGANVQITYEPPPGGPDPRKFVTDNSGMVIATGLYWGTYNIRIHAAGYAKRQHRVHLSSLFSRETSEDQLDPGGIVRGVVVDESGKPVAGVWVDYSSPVAEFGWGGDAMYTDKDGKFQDSFAPLDKPIEVYFWPHDFESTKISGKDGVLLTREKHERDLRVVLHRHPPGGSLVATVTDPAGRPIPEAHASCRNCDEASPATSDANGRFRLDGLIGQGAKALDHAVVALQAPRFFEKTVELKVGTAAHPSESTIKLEPAHTARGRVIDDRGHPVAQAKILLYDPGPTNVLRETYTANVDGWFAIDSPPKMPRFSIETPYGSSVENVPIKLDTPQPVTYTVESPGVITARVVDAETRKPITQFHVRVDSCDRWMPGDVWGQIELKKWWNPGTTVHATDGRFTIRPIANRYAVEMIVDADGYERNIVPHVRGQRPSQATELTIVLLPVKPQDYSTLGVRFVDDRGRGIAGVNLQLGVSTRPVDESDHDMAWQLITEQVDDYAWIEQHPTATTDSDGHYEFTKLLPGRYLQLGYWGDNVPTNLWTAANRTSPGKKLSITIKVPPLATLHATIDRKAMPDAEMVYLSSTGPADTYREVVLAAKQTSFEFVDLPPGKYSLGVYAKPKQNQPPAKLIERQITVSPGENPPLSFTAADKVP